jgi:hypothetical protein
VNGRLRYEVALVTGGASEIDRTIIVSTKEDGIGKKA